MLYFWLVVLCAPLSFGSPVDEFKAANQLYDAGKFAEAIRAYEKIEPTTAHVFFNLGNAYFRDKQLGKAILNYEYARQLSPRDPDILANLRFAEERLGVDAANLPPSTIARFLNSVILSRTLNEWSGYELAGVWLTVLMIGFSLWLRRTRAVFVSLSVAAFICFGSTLGVIAFRVSDERLAPKAIVIVRQTEARFAPLADSTVHYRLAEGMRVAIREDRGQWLLVERASGEQGWIRNEAVKRINAQDRAGT